MDFEEHEGTSHAYLAPPRLDFDENPCDLFSTSQSGCCLEIPSVIPAASQHKDAEARAQKSKARARAHKNNEANRRKRNQEALSALQSLLTAPIRTHSDVLEAARTEILSLRSKLGRNRPSPGDAASNSPSKKLKKRVRTDPLMEGRTDHPEATWMADLDDVGLQTGCPTSEAIDLDWVSSLDNTTTLAPAPATRDGDSMFVDSPGTMFPGESISDMVDREGSVSLNTRSSQLSIANTRYNHLDDDMTGLSNLWDADWVSNFRNDRL